MKKFTSILMAAVMAVVMCTAVSVTALADNVKSPTATTATTAPTTAPTTSDVTNNGIVPPTTTVNGENSDDIIYNPKDTNANEITFVYDGEGTFIRWEQNLKDLGLVEGTDYTLVLNDDDSMVITFISAAGIAAWENGSVAVNAVVDFGEDEEPTKKVTTTKKNASSKSPSTGVDTGVIGAGIAVLGAGIAVLAASKKKDAE